MVQPIYKLSPAVVLLVSLRSRLKLGLALEIIQAKYMKVSDGHVFVLNHPKQSL